MKSFPKLILSILIPLSAGFIGSLFTASSVQTWYQTINKPEFNPPSWIFAPVWTMLFILIGVSFYFLWQKGYLKETKNAFYIYFVQLFLNILWSVLFFGLKNPLLAFIDIIALLIAIVFSIILFYKISKPSAYLFIPYFLWVSFASVLNFSIVILN